MPEEPLDPGPPPEQFKRALAGLMTRSHRSMHARRASVRCNPPAGRQTFKR
jgi:hypothetical protein